MRIIFASSATPALPISILLLPGSEVCAGQKPNAILSLPDCIESKGTSAAGRVVDSSRIVGKRKTTVGRVVVAGGIAIGRTGLPIGMCSEVALKFGRRTKRLATLLEPVVLLCRELKPVAVFSLPAPLLKKSVSFHRRRCRCP